MPLLTQSEITITQSLRGLAATKPTKALESDLSPFRTVMFPLQQSLAVLGMSGSRALLFLAPCTLVREAACAIVVAAHVSCSERNSFFHNISIKNGYHEVSSRGVCFLLWVGEETYSDLTQVVLHVKIHSLGQINAVKGHILLALCRLRSERYSSALSSHLLVMIDSFPLTTPILEAFWICLVQVPDLLK